MRIEVFGLTDVGTKREANEDNFLCLDLSRTPIAAEEDFLFLAVADGIGGHLGGATASSMAVQAVRENIRNRLEEGAGPLVFRSLLEESFHSANQRIFEKASRENEFFGMGTTLVAAVLRGGKAFIANVGDSRAYHIRRGEISRISRDHSWAEEQRRMNGLSEQDILRSPYKNMITRSLGFGPDVEVDHFQLELDDEDYLLLCTDGLYGMLDDKTILKIFRKRKTPMDICRQLIRSANHMNSDDNVTAVVAHWRGIPSKKRPLSDTVRLKVK